MPSSLIRSCLFTCSCLLAVSGCVTSGGGDGGGSGDGDSEPDIIIISGDGDSGDGDSGDGDSGDGDGDGDSGDGDSGDGDGDTASTVGNDCSNDDDCDDGLFCNGAEVCDADGTCAAGTAPDLDDGVECTDDACDEDADEVVHTANDGHCDNGIFCDGSESCDAVDGCGAGTPPPVDDGVGCTDDYCDEAAGEVVHAPNDGACDNGLFCDGAEACDPDLDCQPGTPPAVDDGVDCTSDFCDEASDQVVHAPDDGYCSNGLFCDGVETCHVDRGCLPGTSPPIDDGVGCTNDYCDEASDQVVHAPDDGYCDNGLFCDGAEWCDENADCLGGAPPVIDDGIPCTADYCDENADQVVHDYAQCAGDEHLSEPFIGANGPAGGCSYGGKHALTWDNLGNMTWKECMTEASKRGAMLASTNYTTTGGWNTHRNGNNILTSQQWNTYNSDNLNSSRACIVGRDPDAITNDVYLGTARTYDGNLWIYDDLGTLYYDQCQEAAGNAGASIITPGTIGTGTGDNYFVNSLHMCNTYQWITNNGTNFAYDNIGSAQRSSARSCMIGYMGLPHECRRAADNTVWCLAPDGTTSGNDMCRYPQNYGGTYYAVTQAGADVWNLGPVTYADCATNYVRPGGQLYGSTLGCWTNEMRWARELGGDYRNIVRCTNFE